MSDATDLAEIKANIITALKTASANPKPNYSVDGQSVSWGDYFKMLNDQLTAVNLQINAETPYEYETRVI